MKLRFITITAALILSAFSGFQNIHAKGNISNNNIIASYNFDDITNSDWMGFGSCFVTVDQTFGDAGNSSLKISSRELTWNGPLFVANDIAKMGQTISFYSKIYHNNTDPDNFKVTLKIISQAGEEEYRTVAEKIIDPGQWTDISGSFTVDFDAVAVLLYIETDTSLCDFFIDTVRFVEDEITSDFSPYEADEVLTEEVKLSDMDTIYHEDFESGSVGKWAPLDTSTLYLKNDPLSDKNTCLAICNRHSTYDSPLYNITDLIISKEKYYFTAKIYNQSDMKEKYTWTARIQNSNGVTNYLSFATVSVESHCWGTISGALKIPEDVIDIEIYFDTLLVNSEYCIDDVSIKGTKNKEQKKITVPKNGLLYDFEKDMGKWKSRGELRIFRTDSESRSGKYSLFVSERPEVWNGAMLPVDFLQREKSYTFDAYVKYTGKEYDDEQTFLMKLQYQYQGKTEYSPIGDSIVKKNRWTRLAGNFTLPDSAENVLLYIQTIDTATPTPSDLMPFYIDDVFIIETNNSHGHVPARKAYDALLVFIPTALIAFLVIKIVRKKKETAK